MSRLCSNECEVKRQRKYSFTTLRFFVLVCLSVVLTSCFRGLHGWPDAVDSEEAAIRDVHMYGSPEGERIILAGIVSADSVMNEQAWSAMLHLAPSEQDLYVTDLLAMEDFVEDEKSVVPSLVSFLTVRVQAASELVDQYASAQKPGQEAKDDYHSVRSILRLCCKFKDSLEEDFDSQIHELLRKASFLPGNPYLLDGYIRPSVSFLNLKRARVDREILLRLRKEYAASRRDWRIDAVLREAEELAGIASPEQVHFREATGASQTGELGSALKNKD